MSRFYSIPGVSSYQNSGRPTHPPVDENPQFEEYLRSRSATSHDALGLDPGMKVNFVTPAGEDRPGEVIREERDEHTGNIYAHIKTVNSSGTPEEHKLTFKPDEARSMRQTDNVKVK